MTLALFLTELKFWVGLFHVVAGLLLIFLVLLHSGKGGGLSDMFGGGMGATAAGSTVAERNLDRITVVAALVWFFTADHLLAAPVGAAVPSRRAGAPPRRSVASLALLLAGCGDDGGDADHHDGARHDHRRARDGPVVGGTLRLGVGAARSRSTRPTARPDSPSSLDRRRPALRRAHRAWRPAQQAATPAVAADVDDIRRRADLALRARPGAHASATARAVTAADVEVSLERVVSQGGASLTASRLDTVEGYEEFLDAGGRAGGADLPASRRSTTRPSRSSSTRPMASLPELLAAPAYGIVSRAGVSADGAAFARARRSAAARSGSPSATATMLALVRAPDREPLLDGIELHQLRRPRGRLRRLRGRRARLDPACRRREADAAAEHGDAHGSRPFQAELFFGFNLADDLLRRRAVPAGHRPRRRPRRGRRGAVYFGVAEPLAGVVPAGVPGADPSRCGDGCRHDRAAAEALLAEAFPGGACPRSSSTTPTAATRPPSAGDPRDRTSRPSASPSTCGPTRPPSSAASPSRASRGCVSLGWVGVQADRRGLRRPAVPHRQRPTTSSPSPSRTVDALLDQAATTLDAGERTRLVGEAEAAVLDVVALVPIAQFVVLAVARARGAGPGARRHGHLRRRTGMDPVTQPAHSAIRSADRSDHWSMQASRSRSCWTR